MLIYDARDACDWALPVDGYSAPWTRAFAVVSQIGTFAFVSRFTQFSNAVNLGIRFYLPEAILSQQPASMDFRLSYGFIKPIQLLLQQNSSYIRATIGGGAPQQSQALQVSTSYIIRFNE